MLMDNPWLTVATVVTVGVLRLMGDVIRWLAARSGERIRARMVVELVRGSGPGTVLTDHRADGAALTVRRPGEAECGRGGQVGADARDGGRV